MEYETAKKKFCTETVNSHLFIITEKEAETVFSNLWNYMKFKPDKAGEHLGDLMKPYLNQEHVIILN